MTFDLTIALRVSPILSRKHIWFQSKYDLVETCFHSLIQSLQGLSYELIVILDNCPNFRRIFTQRIKNEQVKILYTKAIGNVNTFLYQIHILQNQAKSEYVYFAEDDYYYVGKMSDIFEFFNEGTRIVDFVTPYDHPDYYKKIHGYNKTVATFKGREWKQVASSTMTFLTSKKNLRETARIFKLYPFLWDHLMWTMLTRKIPPWKLMHPTYGYLDYKLRFFAPYAIRNYPRYRKYFLWAPQPTIATHIDANGLSPRICWETEISRYHEGRSL